MNPNPSRLPGLLAITLLTGLLAPTAYADDSSVGAKTQEAAHSLGDAAVQVGQDAKHAGKEVAAGAKKVGKDGAEGAKETGTEVKKTVKKALPQ